MSVLAMLLSGGAAPGPPTTLHDTFTGSAGDLISHTPEVGGTWTRILDPGTPVIELDGSGNIGCISPGTQNAWTYYNDVSLASADCSITIVIKRVAAGLTFPCAGIRCSTSGEMYQAWYNDSANNWQMRYKVGAAFTNLGATISQTLAIGDTAQCTLSATGTSIKMDVQGVSSVTVSDSNISAKGFPAVLFETNGGLSTGCLISEVTAS
jgi:hypothetical protein